MCDHSNHLASDSICDCSAAALVSIEFKIRVGFSIGLGLGLSHCLHGMDMIDYLGEYKV